MTLDLVEYNSIDVRQILMRVKGAPSEKLESETIEFKNYSSESGLHNDKKLAEEVCALANHRGGVLIVGVIDSSNIRGEQWEQQLNGFTKVDEVSTLARLSGKLQDSTKLRVENVQFEEKNYTAIFVDRDVTKLITTTSGKTCIRDGRDSRPMSSAELQHTIKSLQSYDWTGDSIPEATVSDLCEEHLSLAVQEYCKRRSISANLPAENFLESIGATKNGILTKGGLLFLGKVESIRKHLGDFEFRISWKEGTSLLLNQVWSENLWSAIGTASKHFQSFIRTETLDYSGKTYGVPNLDQVALDEAFINAVVHRDYSIDGMISVEFTGHDLTITSPGTFYGGVTSKNIAWHEPRHRNKNLARMLMEFRLVDRAGMGIQRMGVQSLVYGRKFPEFEELEDSVRVRMEAEFLRPGIFVLTQDRTRLYISDLILLNSLYEKGDLELTEALRNIKNVTREPWESVILFTQRWDNFVQMVGSKESISICIRPETKSMFKVAKGLREPRNSENFVRLFKLLKQHGSASNQDIADYLGYSHSSGASRFLSDIKWIQKAGKGIRAKWQLSSPYDNPG